MSYSRKASFNNHEFIEISRWQPKEQPGAAPHPALIPVSGSSFLATTTSTWTGPPLAQLPNLIKQNKCITFLFLELREVSKAGITVPASQVRKLRPREKKQFAQGHTASL